MELRPLAVLLIVVGATLIVTGLLVYFGGNLSFFGKLPGDIRIERPQFKFYFPIVTCLLISLILSLIFYLVGRWR